MRMNMSSILKSLVGYSGTGCKVEREQSHPDHTQGSAVTMVVLYGPHTKHLGSKRISCATLKSYVKLSAYPRATHKVCVHCVCPNKSDAATGNGPTIRINGYVRKLHTRAILMHPVCSEADILAHASGPHTSDKAAIIKQCDVSPSLAHDLAIVGNVISNMRKYFGSRILPPVYTVTVDSSCETECKYTVSCPCYMSLCTRQITNAVAIMFKMASTLFKHRVKFVDHGIAIGGSTANQRVCAAYVDVRFSRKSPLPTTTAAIVDSVTQ